MDVEGAHSLLSDIKEIDQKIGVIGDNQHHQESMCLLQITTLLIGSFNIYVWNIF